jgi:formate hydrogenlyase subunit 6/NADH:ubiquinone oxidoreductase subunit I
MILSWIREIVDGVEATMTGIKTTVGYARDYVKDEGQGSVVTTNYPEVAPTLPKGYRGHLFNEINKCTGCKSCARSCPIDCFAIETELSEGTKLHISRFDIDLSKCIYCGLCENACPHDCLHMTTDFKVDPVNGYNKLGKRYLFRRRPDQIAERLTTQDIGNLHRITSAGGAQVREDVEFFDRIEDVNKGKSLIGIYGEGYWTPEEKARVTAIRDEKKRQKEAAIKAEAEAKAMAEQAPGAERSQS